MQKPWYHLHVLGIDLFILRQIVAWLGRDDTKENFAAASTGFRMSRRKEWINATCDKLAVTDFVKMNIMQALHCRICVVEIMGGHANNSHVMRDLPQGSGGDILADVAHVTTLNYAAVF